jgi:hypothetical protein
MKSEISVLERSGATNYSCSLEQRSPSVISGSAHLLGLSNEKLHKLSR